MPAPFKEISLPSGSGRLFRGDCLDVTAALPAGSIDLIYLDPPFFTGREQRAAVVGKVRSFADTWQGGMPEYLAWLTPRLAGIRRLLTARGSLFVHLDWHASHYVKCALDGLFGAANFRNEIVWHYGSGGRAATCSVAGSY